MTDVFIRDNEKLAPLVREIEWTRGFSAAIITTMKNCHHWLQKYAVSDRVR